MKCFEISSSLAVVKNQFFADLALVNVSVVVKVLDTTINSVVSGFNLLKISLT